MKKPTNKTFKNREKEADYWEKNIDEALDKSKPTKAKFSKNLTETINVRLDPKTLAHVRKTAHHKGLGPTQLIRMWIKEKMADSDLRVSR